MQRKDDGKHSRLGVYEIVEEVVNHTKSGVVVVKKYRYEREKWNALLKWEGLRLRILKMANCRYNKLGQYFAGGIPKVLRFMP